MIQSAGQSNEGQIVIEKNEQGETRARGFDIQPVVVTDDWGSIKDSGTIASQGKLSSVNEERGFGLKPLRAVTDHKREIDSSVESSVDETRGGLVSGTLEQRGLDLTPAVGAHTEGRGFDLQPVGDAAGFSLLPSPQARGLDLKPAVVTSPEVTGGGRGYDLQAAEDSEGHGFSLQPASEARGLDLSPGVSTSYGIAEGERGYDLQAAEERHGFSLQPVVNLLQADKDEPDDEDDDTPPPESLQSIKNIARARKTAGRVSLKKSTETSVTAKKTSKISKEKPGKKTAAAEKSQQKKEKAKVSGSNVDKSNLFKPSPSSGPSWSPTPTMRSSKTKVRLERIGFVLISLLL